MPSLQGPNQDDPNRDVKDVAKGLGIAGGVIAVVVLLTLLGVVAIFAIGAFLLFLACGGH
jgi:hypothetical protein